MMKDTDVELTMLRRDVDQLRSDFTQHREESLISRQEIKEDVKLILARMDEIKVSTEGVVSAWNAANVTGKFVKWVGGLVAAVVAMWAVIKNGGPVG